MNRILLSFAAVASVSGPLLLVDSAFKGAAVLSLAAVVVLILRRHSAASRHLVWLAAFLALLAVPICSVVLPRWQALPAWASLTHDQPNDVVTDIAPVPAPNVPFESALPPDVAVVHESPAAEATSAEPLFTAEPVVEYEFSNIAPEGQSAPWSWFEILPAVWVTGFSLLVVRLALSRLVLSRSERRGTVIATLGQGASSDSDDSLTVAFFDAAQQLGLRRRVRLTVHQERSIPVVWGVVRHRLMLPDAARDWDSAQLRSVLLHELAHIKRLDAIAQLVAQCACAVHWFNPLVWFAAWRLHVERERACDDLVLGSGVRPSAYASHLLHVATKLSPADWTSACGLAMAGRSSLEGRLHAILTERLDRRRVSATFAVLTLLVAVTVAIPVAMLQAAQNDAPPATPVSEPDQFTNSDNDTPDSNASDSADGKSKTNNSPAPVAVELSSEHPDAQSLFAIWQANARADGKIPGALIGRLAEMVEYFIELNDGGGEGGRMSAEFKDLLPSFVATKDWTASDAVALLDDVAAIHRIPINNMLDSASARRILTGNPLPPELVDAAWGEPAENGLRVAWHLEPRLKQHRLGSSLRSRILVHNSGEDPVFFVMPSWQQTSGHTAKNASDEEISVTSTYWTTMAQMRMYRLAPGSYCETYAPGIGVGPRPDEEDWANIRPGAWVLATEGDEVRFTPGKVEVRMSPFVVGSRKMNEFQKPKNAADLWDKIVAARIARETPLPTDAANREQLLRRLVRDLYGAEPTRGEIDAYVADQSPGALHPIAGRDVLKLRVIHNRTMSPFTGTLNPGEHRFRVLAADPDAAKRPRVATGPGYYNLGDKQRLSIEQSRTAGRRTNKATIRFFTKPKPDPHSIALPDGHGTFAIAWDGDANVLWIGQSGLIRKVDFSNADDVKETLYEMDRINTDVPPRFRNALKVIVAAESARSTASTKLPDGFERRLQWGEPVNGLRAALVRPPLLGLPEIKQVMDFHFVLQNVSDTPIRFAGNSAAPNPRRLSLRSNKGTLSRLVVKQPSNVDVLIQPREVTVMRVVPVDGRTGTGSLSRNTELSFVADMEIKEAPSGCWTGKIVAAEMFAAFAGSGLLPENRDARELFKIWNANTRWNGKLPGGLIGLLAESVTRFTDSNPTWKTTPQLLAVLPKLDATRDWSGSETISLLDEIAAIQTTPLSMALETERARTINRGRRLPKELRDAPWGQSQSNGLRMAWLLAPHRDVHRLGTPLKSRILFHNNGKDTVVFRTRNWHQSSRHKSQDADGNEIRNFAMSWTTRALFLTYRLRPDEYVEISAAGVGVGPRTDGPDWVGSQVGMWIEAAAGDTVTFTPDAVSLAGKTEPPHFRSPPGWWKDVITARLNREKPVPSGDEVRRRMLYRVAMDLFGTPLAKEYNEAFIADRNANAFETLADRLTERPGTVPFTGSLKSGPTTFRVVAEDADIPGSTPAE